MLTVTRPPLRPGRRVVIVAMSLFLVPLAAFVPASGPRDRVPSALTAPVRATRAAVEPRSAFYDPALSPDGAEIAFVSGGDIWTVPATGGAARLLISDPATESRPLYSPDGSRLAFVSTRTGNGDIYVLTFATGALERLTFSDGLDQLDAWSRDGRWLYFSTSSDDISGMDDVLRVSVDGGTPMPVTADRYASEYWAAPAPDGATLAFTARGIVSSQWWRKGHSHLDESEIWLLHPGTPRRYESITTGATGAKSAWPMWSADGHTLYYMSDRSGAENIWAQPVGGAARAVTSFGDGRVLWPTIAANGRTIAFERNFAIWTLDVASGRAHEVPITLRGAAAGPASEHVELTSRFRDLALSPDGKKIAFTAHGELFAAAAAAGAPGAGGAAGPLGGGERNAGGGDAMRITSTPGEELQPAWSPDSRQLVYVSDRDGPTHLYLFDFATNRERRLTSDTAGDVSPRWSPNGRSIAFLRGGRELRVLDVHTGVERRLATAELEREPFLRSRPFDWSPDSRWIAYLAPMAGQFDNAYVVSASGGAAQPVSFVPDAFGGSISWSGDGTSLFFSTGQRTEMGRLARVDLVPRTPRFRENQFRDLFREESPRPATPRTTPSVPDSARPARASRDSARADTSRSARVEADHTGGGRATSAGAPVRIVFDGIRERLTLLPVGIDVDDEALSPDGKSVLLTASAAGEQNLYIYSLDELATAPPVARQLTATAGRKNDAQFSPDGKSVYYLEGGRVMVVPIESRQPHPLAVTAEMDVDFATERLEVFQEAWRFLADNFVDPHYNGVDWRAMHDRYEPYIAGARTPDEVRRIILLMIGELNSSHSGIGAAPGARPSTGRLGVRFDPDAYAANGHLRVSEVLPLSPAALAAPVSASNPGGAATSAAPAGDGSAGIRTGEYLLAVNGTPIGAHTNLDQLLDHTIDREVRLTLAASADGARSREVVVRPVNTATEKGLLYRDWVERNRAYVARVSGGRLGYVHMPDMSATSLDQLYFDLDAENRERDGVVIDVRNNNGGFVNPYAIDVLSRRPYLIMTRRDGEPVPARTQLGQRSLERPTILITNQHSLSDAEDFTQGYRALGLGKTVGEPTAGWIIFTSNVPLIDGSSLRIPSTRITTTDGQPMEMHPRPVDIAVERPIGSSYAGKFPQLDAAVHELLGELESRPRTAARGGKE